jgi:hypothetical protein
MRAGRRAYRRWMRRARALLPSSRLFGAAPRHDGLWVSLWATARPVVCVTVGVAPGDASTVKRSIQASDPQAALDVARRRLSALWNAYLADRAGRFPGGTVRAASVAAPVVEGPVGAGVTRAALRDCFVW